MRLSLVPLIALAACAHPAAPTPKPAPAPPLAAEPPLSDPAEYAIAHVSREAGEAIFTRTGIGDPYKTGVPYPIFVALVQGYPDLFGGGGVAGLADRFGFLARPADPSSDDPDVRAGLPVGMHLTIDPLTSVPFVVTNCTLCHAERVRWLGGEALVVGLGNRRVKIHAYDAAFVAVAARVTPEKLRRLSVGLPEAYADAFVGATIAALKLRAAERTELVARTKEGPPGRVATIDAFVPALAKLAHKAIGYSPVVGWAKIPDVIGFGVRTTLSWDGSGEGPMDLLAVEADVAAGARVTWFERHPLQGASLGAYLRQPAPRPAFPGPVNTELAARGRALFLDHCAQCHGKYDRGRVDYTESIVELSEIGTDPARAEAITDGFAAAGSDPALTHGYTKVTRHNGYVPPVLLGVWLHAPYGHNGQWPNLEVIATPPAQRPVNYALATDTYDLEVVGFAIGSGVTWVGTKPGFSVQGHPFLADLGSDARSVIEYLKTL